MPTTFEPFSPKHGARPGADGCGPPRQGQATAVAAMSNAARCRRVRRGGGPADMISPTGVIAQRSTSLKSCVPEERAADKPNRRAHHGEALRARLAEPAERGAVAVGNTG